MPRKGRLHLQLAWHFGCSGGSAMENELEPLKLLTLNEAAELLQVSRRTLQRMLNRKELPALKVGGQWRIHEKRLAQWLEGLHDL